MRALGSELPFCPNRTPPTPGNAPGGLAEGVGSETFLLPDLDRPPTRSAALDPSCRSAPHPAPNPTPATRSDPSPARPPPRRQPPHPLELGTRLHHPHPLPLAPTQPTPPIAKRWRIHWVPPPFSWSSLPIRPAVTGVYGVRMSQPEAITHWRLPLEQKGAVLPWPERVRAATPDTKHANSRLRPVRAFAARDFRRPTR